MATLLALFVAACSGKVVDGATGPSPDRTPALGVGRDGGKWNDLTPARLGADWPEVAVVSRQMVYDTRLDALVLFGGVRSNSTFSDDMYLWH